MQQKKVAVIQDMSGYGRCSLTVALPILSAYGLQACPLPTSILSCHTAFPTYSFFDFTEQLPAYMASWEQLGLVFDSIYIGFLGSAEQIRMVKDFVLRFSAAHTRVYLDPVMGDEGEIYATYTGEMCQGMRELVWLADVITPNVTEACILAGEPCHGGHWKKKELTELCRKIGKRPETEIVVTGLSAGGSLSNFLYLREGEECLLHTRKSGPTRPGTGDVFASVLVGEMTNGTELKTAVRRASHFVKACIAESDRLGIPHENGVCFERRMKLLR